MLNNEPFFRDIKRKVLVAEDEYINRVLLENILSDEYEVILAADGEEALAILRSEIKPSIVLLDLQMPKLSGMELLKIMGDDEELSRIPVLVQTSSQEHSDEIECLKLGAVDFIMKPYNPEVLKTRVKRVIELYEGIQTINLTERDGLSGLLTREFFYRYAGQEDELNPEADMDAYHVDINHFHLLNARYGKEYGDRVISKLGANIYSEMRMSDGMACRLDADTFLIYTPHRSDSYSEFLDRITANLSDETENIFIRMRMGVYPHVSKSIPLEQRFDRAKAASDQVRGSYTNNVGVFDETLHSREIDEEQLVEDFRAGIDQEQFRVFYQPKFNIKGKTPYLYSAEALVRWEHPERGMVSPGVFIPLFENNGLVRELDRYVWKAVAKQIRKWKDEYGWCMPVSVNVSRMDLFDPEILDVWKGILSEYSLDPKDFYLEITESAYTSDSEQVIESVAKLRELGLPAELDDFGTGYSSLSMLSTMPVDALKIDMEFVRNAFREGGSTSILQVIINIARHLNKPVIAEGVENEEQLQGLKKLGCDVVQGYYFSKPVEASVYGQFIEKRLEYDRANAEAAARLAADNSEHISPEKANRLITDSGEDGSGDELSEESRKIIKKGVNLKRFSIIIVAVAMVLAVALIAIDLTVNSKYVELDEASERYITAISAANDMESGSDYLTNRVRSFLVNGDIKYLKDFFNEVKVTKRRDNALEDIRKLLNTEDSKAYESLATALDYSNTLMEKEYLVIKLIVESGDYYPSDIPDDISGLELPAEYRGMSAEEMRAAATDLLFNDDYEEYKTLIKQNVKQCTESLVAESREALETSDSTMLKLLRWQTYLILLILVGVLAMIIFISTQIRRPLSRTVELMKNREAVPARGVEELRFVTETYNMVRDSNQRATEKLTYQALHDKLTGLYNRLGFENFKHSNDLSHVAILYVDVNKFKGINDTYGHDVGDRILQKVAAQLKEHFRDVDIISRIGGDEFVIIMTRVYSDLHTDIVIEKIENINNELKNTDDGLPPVSISVGVAFADRENPEGDIFKDADTALYRVKNSGGNGYSIF